MARNIRFSDCHLAEIMDDPEDFGGAKRPMCTFCGKKWPEIIQEPVADLGIELVLRQWKDNDLPTVQMQEALLQKYQMIFWNVTKHLRPQLQKRKKPMYTYSIDKMKWEKTAPN